MSDNLFFDSKDNAKFCNSCNRNKDEIQFFSDTKLRSFKSCKDCRDDAKKKRENRELKKQRLAEEHVKSCTLQIG